MAPPGLPTLNGDDGWSRLQCYLPNLVEVDPVQCAPQPFDPPVVPLTDVFVPPVCPGPGEVIFAVWEVGRWGEALCPDEDKEGRLAHRGVLPALGHVAEGVLRRSLLEVELL